MSTEVRIGLFSSDSLEYRFCSPDFQRARRPVPLAELVAQASAIDAARCERLTFADGALDHPDFFALVDACRDLGLSRFALETDGPRLVEPGVLEGLAARGVTQLFVFAGGMRRKVYEAVMRSPAFTEAIDGIRRAAAAGLHVYVTAPMLAWTEQDLEPLLEYLLHMNPRPTGFFLSVPDVARVPAAARKLLLPHSRLAPLAARLFTMAGRHGLEFGFHGKRGLLPCATGGALDGHGTVFFEHLAMARAERRAERRRVAACDRCSIAQSCPGADAAYLDHFGDAELAPVSLEASMGWQLKPIHRLQQRGVKAVSTFDNDVSERGRSLMRINGHCNMSCSFCFIDRTVPNFDTAQLEQAIDALAERNRDHLVLSGGEPTLHPDLPGLIARAKALGFRTIEVQTNGVRCADPEYARSLAEAGLNKVTVSLHSADPERSDEITRLPGAFAKTVRALHNFRSLGVLTQVAHVITRWNYEELPRTAEFFRGEFSGDGAELSICFGIAQPISDLVYTWVMPRFSEVEPFMHEALRICMDARIGFGGMIGQGGYPPCMLGGKLDYYEDNLEHIYRSPDFREQFHKPERCSTCSFDPWCLGVRKYYVETYGDSEIRPFQADVSGIRIPPAGATEHDGPAPTIPVVDRLLTLRRRPKVEPPPGDGTRGTEPAS